MGHHAELPLGVNHGTPAGYNLPYRCRCAPCRAWRRGYDQGRYRRNKPEDRNDQALRYLKDRGVDLCGPGPFRRNPVKLANIIRVYLGDEPL